MRLQSFLSNAGVASRRKSAEIIEQGSIQVNGVVVHERGHAVNPDTDKVKYKGRLIAFETKAYYLFHKPINVITTTKDEKGRKKVTDYFKNINQRLYPVGRLDRNTSGLLIMTNDGLLANKLSHPSFETTKRYVVMVDRPLSENQMNKFRKGLILGPARTAACEIRPCGSQRYPAYEVSLHEGKNRQIRRMMEILGREVKGLHRYQQGPIELGRLKVGAYRLLSKKEIESLNKNEADK